MSNPQILKSSVAEGVGTFLLVLIGCGSIRLLDLGGSDFSHLPHFAFGLILVLSIGVLGNVSGAHFNPAVSLAFLLQKEINFKTFKTYILAQMIGALLACYALILFMPASLEFGATIPRIPTTSAFVIEMILTSILISVIFFVALILRTSSFVSGLIIGTTVALCSYYGGPLTGASMNPARSFAPNLFQGLNHYTWIYISAPLLSALLTSLFFYYLILQKRRVS